MNYTEIEMEWMKEILRDKEEEIKKLKSDLSLVIKERDDNIKQNIKLKEKIKKMEKAEERFFELMKNYVMNKKEYKDLEQILLTKENKLEFLD